MVRLVFRPYTQIRRSICTSEPLRASTRVSSGFTLFRHSSPSFGSQHTRSTAEPSQKVWSGRRCPPRQRSQLLLSLRARVFHPNTRGHVRLLGPCFKTGRLEPLCQSIKHWTMMIRAVSSHKDTLLLNQGYNHSGNWATFHDPFFNGLRECWPIFKSPFSASATELYCMKTHLTPNASLSAISRSIWLSFQSSFHLSLTVLVRYRSLANI